MLLHLTAWEVWMTLLNDIFHSAAVTSSAQSQYADHAQHSAVSGVWCVCAVLRGLEILFIELLSVAGVKMRRGPVLIT